MAQSIINTGNYSILKDGQPVVTQEPFSADAVTIFADGDFTITKTPSSTVWQNTAQPLLYTIQFDNASGTTLDSITLTDIMPAATDTDAGMALDVESISPSITPPGDVTFDSSASSASQLSLTATGTIAEDAQMTVTFNVTYVSPLTP